MVDAAVELVNVQLVRASLVVVLRIRNGIAYGVRRWEILHHVGGNGVNHRTRDEIARESRAHETRAASGSGKGIVNDDLIAVRSQCFAEIPCARERSRNGSCQCGDAALAKPGCVKQKEGLVLSDRSADVETILIALKASQRDLVLIREEA